MCIRDSNVADFTQSEYLNDLYGGNYTFSTEANPCLLYTSRCV